MLNVSKSILIQYGNLTWHISQITEDTHASPFTFYTSYFTPRNQFTLTNSNDAILQIPMMQLRNKIVLLFPDILQIIIVFCIYTQKTFLFFFF